MDLRQLSRDAAKGQHLRQVKKRQGRSGPFKIWSEEEQSIVRRLYPDYRALSAALPNRSLAGIRYQALQLGITSYRHIWTASQHSRLRALYPQASREVIMKNLPGLSWQQIVSHAVRSGFRRKKVPFLPTGSPLLDEIRAKCRQLDYTMGDLDELARTKPYFRRSNWRKTKRPSSAAVSKAVAALGGTLMVEWQD